MKDLSFILSNMKKKRGALDFDIPEADIILDDNGKVIDVKERKVLKSHKLIEDFMVCANEIVAETIKDMDLPFIYRVHDKPEEYKMERLEKLLKAVKINFKKKSKSLNAYFLQDVLKNLKDDDKALKANILRMMAKAEYSSLNIGHFGLASKCYTHFTSPIRRYPDLLVHRLIRKYIINSEKFYATYNKEEEEKLNSKIREIATISTDREINANMCEFEAIDMKKAEYMESHVGEVYDAVITSVLSSGFFVSLDNTIEGMVHIRSLKSDRFYYDAGSSALVGKNNGKAYMQGMKVKVICTYANKEDREVGFILYSDSKQTKSVLKYKKKH